MIEIGAMRVAVVLIFLLILFGSKPLRADDPGFPGGDPDVPIDGGVLVLLIAGAYYGIRKISRNKEDSE